MASSLFIAAGAETTHADELEQGMFRDLRESRNLVTGAEENLKHSGSCTAEINRLKKKAEDLRAAHILLVERLKTRNGKAAALGGKALDRQNAVAEGYAKALEEYLAMIDALPPDGSASLSALEILHKALYAIVHLRKPPIIGSLPYKNLKFPAKEPDLANSIIPAYQGGNQTATSSDTAGTPEAPISEEIAELAKSLNFSPVLIYEWVKNNVDTEWYWGSMKGAEETMRQKSGNDTDQAALLAALLRASGFPSRYVHGAVEFFPDMEKAKNLTGVSDPAKLAAFFQKAGIPSKPIIAGGKIVNFQIGHVWVESLIPYSNYRGAIIDGFGKTWLALDTSLKPPGYNWNSPSNIPAELPVGSFRDTYLAGPQTQTPLEYTKATIEDFLGKNSPGISYQQMLRGRTPIPEVLNILPASLQFRQVAVTGEYTSIPDTLIHKVRFSASNVSGELFSTTLDSFKLAGKKTVITYEPETVEDQAIIDSYGGIDNTPPYLVRLRPVLKVNDERIVVAGDGLPMGADYTLTIEVITPNGTEKTVSGQIAGNIAAIAVIAQKSADNAKPDATDNAETLLYKEARGYINRWNKSEDELAALLGISIIRPVPTVATVGNLVDVTYLLDAPHDFQWKGVFLDANLRGIEAVAGTGDTAREKTFMRLSALEGSVLENRMFEDDFHVDSISTAKLLQLATTGGAPLLTLDRTNIETILPGLVLDDAVKADILNAVQQNLSVIIPQSELTYQAWTGIGYIKENIETGESGWMLSGMVAGGMTAMGINDWTDPMAAFIEELLQNPDTPPANKDPLSAATLYKITATDLQQGTAGKALPKALQIMVLDAKKHPVEGADVIFFAKAGKGTFAGDTDTLTVKTDKRGIATAPFTPGKQTSANPMFFHEEGKTYSTQVGENIIGAGLASGLELVQPFIAYAFPDKPVQMVKTVQGINQNILSYAGPVIVSITDSNGNPVANVPVDLVLKDVKDASGCANPNKDQRPLLFVTEDFACLNKAPLYGECGGKPAAPQQLTSSDGTTSAGIILGGIPGAVYTVSAASEGLPSVEFKFATYYFGNCSGGTDPDLRFALNFTFPVDTNGRNINAGKVGSSIPVQARINFLREGSTRKDYSIDCGSGGFTCSKIVGDRSYNTETNFDSASVTFADQAGSDQGKGVFSASYTLKPGRNTVTIDGTAAISVTRTIVCPACATDTQKITRNAAMEMELYGVDIEIPTDFTVFTDNNGYTKADTSFKYTITPAEYLASSAFVQIYENDKPFTYMVTETKGAGTATFAKGLQFDLKAKYEVEVVLNNGSGVEMRSKKIPLYPVRVDGEQLGLVRTHIMSQFDSNLPVVPGGGYFDDFKVLTISLAKPSTVTVKILDDQYIEKGTLVSSSSLSIGDSDFLVVHDQVRTVFSGNIPPYFYLLADITPNDGGTPYKILYPGKLVERTDGEMLGQTIVHDVLIQNGSLTLSRQDFSFQGRGQQIAFSRNYTNLSSRHGQKPLGEGWSHSLDMRMQLLSTKETDGGSVPSWVSFLKGRFFSPNDVPQNLQGWTMVQANGGMFRKLNGVWYSERGRHGRLEEVAGAFIYTSKDGTKYRYDLTGKDNPPVKSIEDRTGNIMTFEYDAQGLLAKASDAVGRSCTMRYDSVPGLPFNENSRLQVVSCPDEGVELAFTYTPEGYLRTAKRGARIETYDYARELQVVNGDFNMVAATDANKHTFRYEYHKVGELPAKLALYTKVNKQQDVVKQVTYPDNHFAFFKYDVLTANKRIVTDLRGKDTIYTLNAYGNPLKIEEPLGKTTLMKWSIDEEKPDNVMTSKTDARGYTTLYDYDSMGNVKLETDPYLKSVVTTWNLAFSLPLTRTDRNSFTQTQTWQYDGKGNLLLHKDGDGKQFSFTYYATGEKHTATDSRGTTIYTYDPWGNPATVSEPEGSITKYKNDIRGRRIALIDPNGRETGYTYDDLDHPATVVYPQLSSYKLADGSTNVKTTVYDPLGNLLSETDRVGLTLTYTYTERDQVKTITRSVGGTKSFGYDENGNLTSETDWKGVATSHTYNDLNRRVTTRNRLGHATTMGYDPAGNLESVIDAEGRVTTHEYDKLNRLADTWQPALDGQERGNLHYTYFDEADPKTNLKTETDQEGHTTSYEYNGRYLRTKRTNAKNDVYLWEYDDNGNLLKETDEESRVTRHEYDRQNRLVALIHATSEGDITTGFKYDNAGNRTHVIDPNSYDTETRYDEWNRPWQVIDPDKFVATNELDGEGREVRTVDSNNHVRSKVRDKLGRVVSFVDGENNETLYSYDLNGNTETVTDAKGTVTRIAYDTEDKKLLTTEAEGQSEERKSGVLLYDKVGNPLQVRNYNGNVRTTEYNPLNLPAKVYDPAPFDNRFIETAYFKTGKVKTATDRRNNTTTYEYDELNRHVKVTDPLNQTIQTTYDKVGNVKTVKDKRNILTENFYDDLNRLREKLKAGTRLVTNVYDAAGNLRFVTDANSNKTEHRYNKRNLLEMTLSPDSTTEKRSWDGVGNLLTLADEEEKVTSYTYDKENRQTLVEFAGEKTEKRYDETGNLTEIIKPEQNGRTMEYDRLKRLTSIIEGGLTTRYEYDANNNLRNQYDPKGNRVEFTWDELNRKKEHIQHKGDGNLVTRYAEYDGEGNLTKLIDAKGQEFTYGYDPLNRRIDEYFPTAVTPFLTLKQVHTEHDGNNNVTAVTETKIGSGGGTVTDITANTWDDFDRLKNGTERDVTVSYDYDNNGNRTLVATPSGAATYTFDPRNRVKTAVSGGRTTSFDYYPDGKKKNVSYPNGASEKIKYFDTNRIREVVNQSGVSVISSYAYTYDRNGNRLSQAEVQNGVAINTSYSYDSLDRMMSYTVSEGSDTTTTDYTFDGYNRASETVRENGSSVSVKNYNYDETDWLKNIEVDEDGAVKTISYVYDRNGNTVRKQDSDDPGNDIVFDYDSTNRLVRTMQGTNILGQYDYNAQGLRIRHLNSDRGDVNYYYDGRAVIEEQKTDGSLLAHYNYADRLMSLATDSSIQYYHFDALGSTVNLTNQTGGVQVSYFLDPWGMILDQEGDSVNRNVFSGKEEDGNTGLIYFGARYYDPDTGRFITQDSYLGEPGTPPSLNRYLYAYSNPTVFIDLYGYWSWKSALEFVRDPAGQTLKTISKGLAYAGRKIDEYVDKNAPGLGGVLVATAAKTVVTVAKGVVDTPEQIKNQTERFIKDPKLENLPILGEVGKNLGVSTAAFVENPNFENGVQVFGAVSSAFLTVAGGAAVPKGISALRGAGATEGAIAAEVSEAAQTVRAVRTVETASGETSTATVSLDSAPLQNGRSTIYVDPKGIAIEAQEGSYFRGTAVTPEIDASMSSRGILSGRKRGVEGNAFQDDAPMMARVLQYVEGKPFPRDSNFVGLKRIPHDALDTAVKTGADTLSKPGAYARLDEINVRGLDVVDIDAFYNKLDISPRPPLSVTGEIAVEGQIPASNIIRTHRIGN